MNKWQLPKGGHIRSHGAPKRSAKELAEEFGLTLTQLNGHRVHSANLGLPAPQALLHHASADARNAWFEPKEMRKWWADYQALAAVQKGQLLGTPDGPDHKS